MDAPADLASLMANPAAIAEALALLRALERLEVVLVVNGVESRGVVRFSEQNAVIEVAIDTE